MIDFDVIQSALRHFGINRVGGRLDDSNAPGRFDFEQSRCSVIEAPRQYDADRAPSVGLCGAPKKRVDGWPRPILSGSSG